MSERCYCDHCGLPAAGTDPDASGGHDSDGHAACRAARVLEPPRYCTGCGRRMVVKVTPTGWSGSCSRHGALAGQA